MPDLQRLEMDQSDSESVLSRDDAAAAADAKITAQTDRSLH